MKAKTKFLYDDFDAESGNGYAYRTQFWVVEWTVEAGDDPGEVALTLSMLDVSALYELGVQDAFTAQILDWHLSGGSPTPKPEIGRISVEVKLTAKKPILKGLA